HKQRCTRARTTLDALAFVGGEGPQSAVALPAQRCSTTASVSLKIGPRAGHAARPRVPVSATEQQRASPPRGDQALDAGTLFRRHGAFVAAFLLRLGIDRAELDDAVQEVFMTVHRRGGYRPGPARPTTWLAEIALRVLSNRRRTR